MARRAWVRQTVGTDPVFHSPDVDWFWMNHAFGTMYKNAYFDSNDEHKVWILAITQAFS